MGATVAIFVDFIGKGKTLHISKWTSSVCRKLLEEERDSTVFFFLPYCLGTFTVIDVERRATEGDAAPPKFRHNKNHQFIKKLTNLK